MKQERWQEIKRIYNSALELESSRREEFVRQACGGDFSIQEEVESLLARQVKAEEFLDVPAINATARAFADQERGRSLVGRTLSHYRVIEKIGQGGMGEVFLADDVSLGRKVAIKVLPEEFSGDAERLARFEREAKVLASLSHPNIATIYGLEQVGNQQFIVMELAEGKTLAQRISRGRLPLDEALNIGRQIAEGLEAAQEKGVIHRDLKPANVMIAPDGKVKILDFGLARVFLPESSAGDGTRSPTITDEMTRPGVILGTAAYMSPEQARGNPADKRSDIWAFGCLLFEMLAGKRPFRGKTVSETLAVILKEEPDWQTLPAATPQPVTRLLRRCLQKNPRLRYHDAADIRLDLQEVSTAPSTAGSLAAPSRAMPWVVAGMLGIALVAALLAWWFVRPAPVTSRISLAVSRDNSLRVLGEIAISRDGRTVAFIAESSKQSRQLYLRRLDEWEARAVPLGVGAWHPFFSPDGQWIAFSRSGKLEKVPVAGGSSQVICDTSTPPQHTWGSWQDDGTVVFSRWPQTGLWRVSSDGGTPQLLSKPVEGDAIMYRSPETLPGNKGILFTLRKAGRAGIAVLAPGADQPRLLVESGVSPRYLPTGHLLYVANDHLMAVPFDAERLATRGGATVVIDDLEQFDATGHYDVSANGVLVYLSAGSTSLNIVWKDRQGQTVSVLSLSRQFSYPMLSPDGQGFSVTVNEGAARNIWIGGVSSEPLTRLTFGEDDIYGVWSRDGKRLFYMSAQAGSYNIYQTMTDGSGKANRLTQSSNPQVPTSVSPDGDILLYHEVDPLTRFDIWELSLSRRKARPLIQTRFNESEASFSPDGHWIAYQSNESGQSEVYVQAYPGPGIRKQVSQEGDGSSFPFWSHSGHELFYQASTALYSVPILDIRNLRLGTPRRLFTLPKGVAFSLGGRQNVSPDDQRFLMLEPAQPSSQLNLVQNWLEELKRLVPVK